MANLRVRGRIYEAPAGINKVSWKPEGGAQYSGDVTAASGYYTYSVYIPDTEERRLIPRVRVGTTWQDACAPTYYYLDEDNLVMDIQCSDCYAPPGPGSGYGVGGTVYNLPIDDTKIQFRHKTCECDPDECEDDHWFKTEKVNAANDYEFSITLLGNYDYSVYHWRNVDGTKMWVACKSPAKIRLLGQTGVLCLAVRAQVGPSNCDGKGAGDEPDDEKQIDVTQGDARE